MIRLVAALLALVTAAPAFAQGHSDAVLTQLVRGGYGTYIGADVTPRSNFPTMAGFKAIEAECVALRTRLHLPMWQGR